MLAPSFNRFIQKRLGTKVLSGRASNPLTCECLLQAAKYGCWRPLFGLLTPAEDHTPFGPVGPVNAHTTSRPAHMLLCQSLVSLSQH